MSVVTLAPAYKTEGVEHIQVKGDIWCLEYPSCPLPLLNLILLPWSDLPTLYYPHAYA